MKVICEVKGYPLLNKGSILVYSNDLDNTLVKLSINGESCTVGGCEPIEAIKNCMNNGNLV